MAATVTSLAGATFTYAVYTGTIQQVLDAMTAAKQNMPSFRVIAMAYDSNDKLSVLVEYST